MLQPKTHIRIGGQMKNEVAARHCLGQGRQGKGIPFDEAEILVLRGGTQELRLAGGEIVVADNGMIGFEQSLREIAADEASRAGHKNVLHSRGVTLEILKR